MNVAIRPLSAVSRQATEALVRELGVVDTLRFLGQFESGSGDYARDRGRWLADLSLAQIVEEIRASRPDPGRSAEGPPGPD